MKIKTCFSETYAADTPVASMRKLQPVANAVIEKYAEQIDPTFEVKTDDVVSKLRRLHNPRYVDSFTSGEGRGATAAFGTWNRGIRDGVLDMQKGQIVAAKLALDHGLTANIAQGFHHACYDIGGGFCTFNGLALVAQEFAPDKVFVLDCDEHGGNGTEDFIGRLSDWSEKPRLHNLYQATIHGCSFGCEGIESRSACFKVNYDFEAYKRALEESFAMILRVKPALVIYQAGVDCHVDDPFGSAGLSTEELRERDKIVFEFLTRNKIPAMFVLAGGYQEPIEEKLVPLHAATFEEAKKALDIS